MCRFGQTGLFRLGLPYVAIDMSAIYRSSIRTGLPEATVVVDHFHVVQLANKMLSLVRRRTTAEICGRRGRASDPEWKARRRLLRNREDLDHEQFERMWNPLLDEGKIGQTLLTAWIAKESLRTLLALARTDADRNQVGHARWKFLTSRSGGRAGSGPAGLLRKEFLDLRIRSHLRCLWPYDDGKLERITTGANIFAGDTGHSNAKSEGINRVIKLVARHAFGFRNADNQRLRTRCVTTRRARGHLRTA
ncbi:transposase [Streptomyces sp. NPDC050997]|uniref:transposase n=1 Tax=Streptomyces sp. NPDC050997 TaxID=3155519 RepID=UPI0034473CCE